MAVFRVEKTRDYTVMANHHLRNKTLTLKAKGLLSLILALPEDWDYTLKGLSFISRESLDAIREAVKELEQAGYIVRSRERNGKGQLKGTEYIIYERPQAVEDPPGMAKPVLENPTLVNPVREIPTLETPVLAIPVLGNPTQLNTNRTRTDLSKTKRERTDGLNPHPSNPDLSMDRDSGWDEMGGDDEAELRQMIRESIEYDCLVLRFKAERLDEIVDLILETLFSQKAAINVAGDDYPASLVKDKLRRLNSMHIEYVFECMDKNTTYIRNIKKYLLATLFNAPSTIDSYYKSQVNHDFYGEGSRW